MIVKHDNLMIKSIMLIFKANYRFQTLENYFFKWDLIIQVLDVKFVSLILSIGKHKKILFLSFQKILKFF